MTPRKGFFAVWKEGVGKLLADQIETPSDRTGRMPSTGRYVAARQQANTSAALLAEKMRLASAPPHRGIGKLKIFVIQYSASKTDKFVSIT